MTDDNRAAILAEKTSGAVGASYLLINNAALVNDPVRLWKTKALEFERLADAKDQGGTNRLSYLSPAMTERDGGVVVAPKLWLLLQDVAGVGTLLFVVRRNM